MYTTNPYSRKNLDKAAALVMGGMDAADALRQVIAECAVAEARAAAIKAVKAERDKARAHDGQLVDAPRPLVDGIREDYERIKAIVAEYKRSHPGVKEIPWKDIGATYRHPSAYRFAHAWHKSQWGLTGCWMQRSSATPELLAAYGLPADTELKTRHGETEK